MTGTSRPRRPGVGRAEVPAWATVDATRGRGPRPRGRDTAPLVGAAPVRRPARVVVRGRPEPVRPDPVRPDPVHRQRRRRRRRSALTLGGVLVVVGAVTGFDPGGSTAPVSEVDFTRVVRVMDAADVGVGVSTYGATPLGDPTQAAVERALDARTVRIPVAFRGGRVTSGAAGAGRVDVGALVRTYRSWGWRVMVVIDGRTTDNDVAPGDTTRIVQTLGYGPDVQYTTSNEPRGTAADLDAVLAQARMIVAEGRAVDPAFTVWAPAWSHYDRGLLQRVGAALGPALAGIDFHRYAMGETAIGTDAAMRVARGLGTEVAAVRAGLAAAGSRAAVAVDELNLTWRYEDGTPGGDQRVFTAVSTAWIAAACGHVLVAGGRCLPYAVQNGPLGMTVESGTPNPAGRPVSTPMPGYWGIGAWTGASRFPHATGALYACVSGSTSLDLFAVDNEAAGHNVVLVNTSTTSTVTTRVRFTGSTTGTWRSWVTDPDRPYDAPVATAARRYDGPVPVTLRPLSVATLVLSPRTGGGS